LVGEPGNLENNPAWECYPNPAKGRFNLELVLTKENQITANIYDLQGRLIKNLFDQTISSGIHHFNYDLALPAGIYHLRLSGKDFVSSKKLVILH